jgi:hypothetical protein
VDVLFSHHVFSFSYAATFLSRLFLFENSTYAMSAVSFISELNYKALYTVAKTISKNTGLICQTDWIV